MSMRPKNLVLRSWGRYAPRLLALGGILGVGGVPSTANAGVADWNARANEFYDLANVVNVEVTMKGDKWNEMRSAEPHGGRCNFGYTGDRYDDYKPVRVRIMGTDPAKTVDVSNSAGVKNVEIKKKSYCGSFDTIKPAFKLKFKDTVSDAVQDLIGVKKVMFNNAKEDSSYIRQCVGYRLLKDAQVPYARCNFARVKVIDADDSSILLDELYVNVEPVEEMFVYNNFNGNMSGNLYEFDVGEDFVAAMKDRTEFKGFSAYSDKQDFERAAEEVVDDTLSNAFDMPEFIKFFAMEMLLDHPDSYTNNRNNVYIYNDVTAVATPVAPGNVSFKFIPGGIDQILGKFDWRTIYNTSILAQKVNGDPVLAEQLRRQIYLYLGSVFNPKLLETTLGAWIQSVEAAANTVYAGKVPAGAADGVVTYLKQRRATMNEIFGITFPTTAVRFEGWNNGCAHRGRASVGTNQWSIDHKPCSGAAGDTYLFTLEPSSSKPGYFRLAYTEGGAPFTYGSRADDSHTVLPGLYDVYYGQVGGNTDYPQYFGLIPVGDGTERRYEIQSVETGRCWHFSGNLKTSENNYQVYQAECNKADKNLINLVEPPPVPPCNETVAIDLGAPGNDVSVPVDGCVKVQNAYPSWWTDNMRMKLENPTSGSYAVPFTWTNTCSPGVGSGSDSFTANWQGRFLPNINSACATVIDLQGTGGGNITLHYWHEN